jgi:hypothetical protein
MLSHQLGLTRFDHGLADWLEDVDELQREPRRLRHEACPVGDSSAHRPEIDASDYCPQLFSIRCARMVVLVNHFTPGRLSRRG